MKLRSYVALLAASAAGSAYAASRASAPGRASSTTSLLAFLALLAAAEYLIVRFHYRSEVMALSLFEAVLAPAFFVLSPLEVVALVAIAQIAAAAGHRIPAIKMIFNVSQWTFAAAAGTLVYYRLHAGATLTGRNVGALFAAMAVVVIVNAFAFILVIHLAEGRTPREVAADLLPTIALGWIVNVGFGSLFVVAVRHSPVAIALCLVPLLALHLASRGLAASVADRRRLAAMNRTLVSLAMPTDPQEAISQFLTKVRECFGARRVEMLLHNDGNPELHVVDHASARTVESGAAESLADALTRLPSAVRISGNDPDPRVAAAFRRGAWRHCIAAPMIVQGRVLGTLCVYDGTGLEGFEESELAILQALAAEAASMIQRASLLDAVLAERSKLAEVMNNMSDGMVTIRANGAIEMWNPGMEQITGFKAHDIIGTKMVGVLRPCDEAGNQVFIERWVENDALPQEIQISGASGATRWLSCSYTPVRAPDGSPHLLIIMARDVTRVRELERLKDDFIATVSHELRTPLTPIKGWASTLLDHGEGLGATERRIALESIVRQADSLDRLITDLLEVSRVERGAHDPRDLAVDAPSVARKVIMEFRGTHPTRDLRLDIPTEQCFARGDDLWVERIISNLVSNAIKYAPAPSPIVVRVAREDTTITISVTDHGPGIPTHEQGRIFDRFARLGDHMTRSSGGAGLGLYIARQLAASMSGTLTVESEPGLRTTFTLSLRATKKLAAVG